LSFLTKHGPDNPGLRWLVKDNYASRKNVPGRRVKAL